MLKRFFNFVNSFRASKIESSGNNEIVTISSRGYTAASNNYQFNDWLSSSQTANEEVLAGGSKLRNRAREAERNDEYIKKFIKTNEQKVVGSQGIRLNMQVLNNDGSLDKNANDAIEKAWKDWAKPANCSATKRNSLNDICRMWAKAIPRDGEIFVQKIPGFNNRYGFALQPYEGDFVPFANGQTTSGNEIVLGCEINNFGAVLAYWFNPVKDLVDTISPNSTRIRSEFICHGYTEERPGQLRGVTETHASLPVSHILNGYREAEVTGARANACRMGSYERDPAYNDVDGEVDDLQTYQFASMAPGDIGVTPKGWKLNLHSNTNVNNNSGTFMKTILRGLASGLGVGYNVLANDYEGVNFSSLRGAVLEDQETYKIKQDQLIEKLLNPVFEMWLQQALLRRLIIVNGTPLSIENYDKYNKPEFIARPFEWVDPLKDAQRSEIEVANGWSSDKQVAKMRGKELRDMYQEQAEALSMKREIYAQFGVEDLINIEDRKLEIVKDESL